MYTSENWKFDAHTTLRQAKLLVMQHLKNEQQIALFIKTELDNIRLKLKSEGCNPDTFELKSLMATEQIQLIQFHGSWRKATEEYLALSKNLDRFLSCKAYGVKPIALSLTYDTVCQLIETTSPERINRYSF